MRLLLLGGPRLLGRGIAEAALAARHELTFFNRGQTGTDLYPEVERLHGDRDGGLDALRGRSWDAAVDTSGYVPRIVQAGAAHRGRPVVPRRARGRRMDGGALWIDTGKAEWRHFMAVDASRAIASGLTFRPLEQTVAATLEHSLTVGGVGLTPAREAELLAAWHAT